MGIVYLIVHLISAESFLWFRDFHIPLDIWKLESMKNYNESRLGTDLIDSNGITVIF